MSRQRPVPQSTGPDFYDVYASVASMMQRYPVQLSVVMEPRERMEGLWDVRLVSILRPRSPAQHTVNATAKPQAIIWEGQWSEKHLLSLPSLVYRGLWEIEVGIIEQLEQLSLPLN